MNRARLLLLALLVGCAEERPRDLFDVRCYSGDRLTFEAQAVEVYRLNYEGETWIGIGGPGVLYLGDQCTARRVGSEGEWLTAEGGLTQ